MGKIFCEESRAYFKKSKDVFAQTEKKRTRAIVLEKRRGFVCFQNAASRENIEKIERLFK